MHRMQRDSCCEQAAHVRAHVSRNDKLAQLHSADQFISDYGRRAQTRQAGFEVDRRKAKGRETEPREPPGNA